MFLCHYNMKSIDIRYSLETQYSTKVNNIWSCETITKEVFNSDVTNNIGNLSVSP